jgi:hypothetical protein
MGFAKSSFGFRKSPVDLANLNQPGANPNRYLPATKKTHLTTQTERAFL